MASVAPPTPALPPAPPAISPPAPPTPRPQTVVETNVRETVESILIAFVLAFVFRAFVVEPFVIPTGSMATTLLGANMRFTCPDCGYSFTVGYPVPGEADDTTVPRFATVESGPQAGQPRSFSIVCPNCGFKLPRHDTDVPESGTTGSVVRYGDRILVLKYAYLIHPAQRWDVVVFKAPPEPERFDYSQNYIKRLIGKPGEKVLVLDGDIYIAPPDKSGDSLDDYQIQTKTPAAQDALWRPVYDNDFHPRGLNRSIVDRETGVETRQPAWRQPWTPAGGTGWTIDAATDPAEKPAEPGRRIFRFDNSTGSGAIRFDPDANPRAFALTDWVGYDVGEAQRSLRADHYDVENPFPPSNNVSDVKLALTFTRQAGDGPLKLELSKLGNYFSAEFSPNQVVLYQRHGQTQTKLGSAPLSPGSKPIRIEMTNVDYRVTVRVDGQDLIQTTPDQYHPDTAALLSAFDRRLALPKATIRITAETQIAQLDHVSLWRDVYYTNHGGAPPMQRALPDDFPNRVARLGPDEYFVMGDNSAVSSDARYWTDPINLPVEDLHAQAGCVPGRFLLGKAFFVYWPAGYRPVEAAPAIIPDFGDIRFIR